jgi:hypothetical protein
VGAMVHGGAMGTIRAKCAIVAIFMPVAICAFGDARDVGEAGERGGGFRDAIAIALCSNMVDGAIVVAAGVFSGLPLGFAVMC